MTSRPFFDFGTNIETVKACLSLIERGCRGEIRCVENRPKADYCGKRTQRSKAKVFNPQRAA